MFLKEPPFTLHSIYEKKKEEKIEKENQPHKATTNMYKEANIKKTT